MRESQSNGGDTAASDGQPDVDIGQQGVGQQPGGDIGQQGVGQADQTPADSSPDANNADESDQTPADERVSYADHPGMAPPPMGVDFTPRKPKWRQ
jgi:hypothetical protein